MLRISEAANLGVHALAYMAADSTGRHVPVTEIAQVLGCSSSHLAKVLSGLARQGLVISSRGAAGGYRLGHESTQLSVLDVIRAVDGPLPEPACLLGRPVCRPGTCIFRDLHRELQDRVTEYLGRIRLADFQLRDLQYRPRSLSE